MDKGIYFLLAILGGVSLAMQGGLNAQLGVQLKSSILASLVAFAFSALFALLLVLVLTRSSMDFSLYRNVPAYLWFSGAFFSVIGICLYYYTIPKLGISTMISLGLFGQLLFATVAGHFGWFGLPNEPLVIKRALGIFAMALGIFLMNKN
ncbi:DMT family transporter [Muricauda sp. MAR_2010_75]|jgi:transporter family-2 protein|uniref:DMT family transporter n=1 Tax=Allomuricauda sp. MAR_2010_75 TaxID=1250232 RepID=UPI0005660F5A|nr:DMT family transporter [Muricauda sp. MAR_2010_75]